MQTVTDYLTDRTSGLPDPDTRPEFYADTVAKRGLAWGVDLLLIAGLVLLTVPLTLFVSLFFLPVVWLAVSFVYRWWGLATFSATPGMRLFAIELRDRAGERLDAVTGFLHVGGYFVSMAVFPMQLVSIALMFLSSRKQGLTDHVLGTAAINRAAT